jgi:hypothetical protein
MTPRLSEDQRQAIEERGGAPVYVVDAASNASYVLMRAEQFEKLRADTEGEVLEALYPLVADIEPDDWEDISQYDKKS